ncbi:MAG: type VI secretion system contractile sheath domain-containing protein, partial [Pseudomonadales bacterium]
LVNQVLSHSGFQTIERSWQGVTWLTSELDLDEQAGLWLLPVDLGVLLTAGSSRGSAAEFEAGFAALQAALQKMVAGIDGGTLRAIGVDGSFETPESIGVLAGLAELARGLSCILLTKAPAGLTEANSTLQLDAGYPPHDETLQQVWQTFRDQPAARHCAAVLPRLMRRLPYGANGEATYLPGFEELEPAPEHRQFPWINPVYGLIYLMAREPAAEDLTITDLPMPVFDDGSGSSIMPCAEAYLSEAETADLQANGIMVFQSYRNRNAVKLSGLFTLS